MKRWVSRLLACGLAIALSEGSARASDPAASASSAELLFREGKSLMDAGKLEEGCSLLAESNRLEPAGGTLLNLASCQERLGRYAAAERALQEALRLAGIAGRADAKAFVEQRLAAVAPNVCVLRIELPAAQELDQTSVRVDDADVDPVSHTLDVHLDPGKHRVQVETIGLPVWHSTIEIEGSGKLVTVNVPLAERPKAVVAPPSSTSSSAARTKEPTAPAASSPLVPIGIVSLAVGGSLLLSGAVAGAFAIDAWSDAESRCPDPDCSDAVGVAAAVDARRFGDTATGLLVAGSAVAIAGGVMLLVTALEPGAVKLSGHGLELRF